MHHEVIVISIKLIILNGSPFIKYFLNSKKSSRKLAFSQVLQINEDLDIKIGSSNKFQFDIAKHISLS